MPAAPRAEAAAAAAADEPNSPLAAAVAELAELRLLFLPLLELLPNLPEPDFDDDLSLDKLAISSEASFLSAAAADDDPEDIDVENVVPVSPPAVELGVSPGRLKLGKPNNGLAKPMPARPPNGKNSGGAAEELLEVVDVVGAVVVELVVDVFDEVVVLLLLVVSPEPQELGSINIFIEAGNPAANRLALNELRAAEDG